MTRQQLAQQWLDAKRREQDANRERLRIEEELLATFDDVPDKGTTYVELQSGDAVKITTGFDVVWDQDALWSIRDAWDASVKDVAFPFHQELRPDTKVMALIRERMPDIYAKFLEPVSSIKPRKPSFSVK